jgi:hypothetical protein
MTSDDRLTDLLVRWQEALEHGHDLPAIELCQGDTALLPELERRLADLRRLTRLAAEIGQSVEQTSDHAGPAADTVSYPAAKPLPQLPDYEVLQELGKGGMGIVYKARDLRLKRVVALKLLRQGDDAPAEQRARFRSEAEAIARLQHPHIVQVFQAGEWQPAGSGPPMPFFAMEYMAGGSLAEIARRGPLSPAGVARLGMLLARGDTRPTCGSIATWRNCSAFRHI